MCDRSRFAKFKIKNIEISNSMSGSVIHSVFYVRPIWGRVCVWSVCLWIGARELHAIIHLNVHVLRASNRNWFIVAAANNQRDNATVVEEQDQTCFSWREYRTIRLWKSTIFNENVQTGWCQWGIEFVYLSGYLWSACT